MKIVTIVGARPQFIKASVVSKELRKNQNVEEIIVHTGQHFDKNMSEVFFEQMKIPEPDYNLGIKSLSHGAMTGRMIEQIEKVLLEHDPYQVIVYGDTNSTLAGALAAKKLHINVAHVEAGLRSFNNRMPEEINRILTDRISDLLFCPTDTAMNNLKNEGFDHFPAGIIKTGDVMKDASDYFREYAVRPAFDLPEDFVLSTIHRAENTDDKSRLQSIFDALKQIAKELPVVIPLHPRSRKKLEDYGMNFSAKENIHIIPSLGYLEMLYLLDHCELVMTDSGGVQKEAYFFHKYCITLRDETEWTELKENNVNLVVGADKNKIIDAFHTLIKKKFTHSGNLYGEGDSAKIIADNLTKS